jgi:hypothetical protein
MLPQTNSTFLNAIAPPAGASSSLCFKEIPSRTMAGMATTLEVYTHASGSAQRDAVNLLEEQLFPNVPKLESCGSIAETESQLVQ